MVAFDRDTASEAQSLDLFGIFRRLLRLLRERARQPADPDDFSGQI